MSVLVALGVAAAVGRGVFVPDMVARAEPFRQELMRFLGRDDPNVSERAEEVRRFDSRFGAHPVVARLHVVPGAIFLALALMQFSPRVRRRHIRFHRWSGRALILMAFVIGSSGLYFTLLMPYAGRGEVTGVLLFTGLFFADIIRAFVAVRQGDIARHREWMIRAYAIAISISIVRVVGVVFDIALTPAGFRPPEILALSLWVGFVLAAGAGEIWIRYTRRRVHPLPLHGGPERAALRT